MSSATSCASSNAMHSTDGSSVTSASYTTASYSTVDPPSHLRLPYNNNHSQDANQSMISGLSEPSASTASHGGYHNNNNSLAVFPPVVEETNSALDDASSPSTPTAPTGNGAFHSQNGSFSSKSADGVNIEINTNTRANNSNDMQPPPSPPGPHLPLECDYDKDPTMVYQIIEAKKWDMLIALFKKDPITAKKEAATWVTRKEPNGKLRWRLLPVHAAVIFQSPAFVVEKLLEECPDAAQAKDDQGMLPLHLAFRTKHTCWETIEALLSVHPQAVFVHDRKGRTPLECGLAAAAAVMEAEKAMQQQAIAASPTAKGLMGALTPRSSTQRKLEQKGMESAASQKSIFSVLELYTQISVQDHLQTAMTNSRKALETRIGAVQDNHVATLTKLKQSWENQRNELSRKIQGYRKEIQNLKSDFNIQQELLEEKVNTEMELVDQLQQVTTALEAKTVMDEDTAEEVARDITNMHSHDLREANRKAAALKKTNKELLLLLETLLDQQNSLKLSLDKLSWDTTAKNKERQDLLNKYFSVHEESVEMAETYTQDWQERLEKTSVDVSAKLAKILSQNKTGGGIKENSSGVRFTFDGEEKKESYISINDSTATCASSISASHQDP